MDAARFMCRPIVFHEPQRAVHPPSWLDYVPFAFWIVEALQPAVFVELGCQSGNSYSAFAQAIRTLDLPSRCYGVDTWSGDAQAGFFDESVFEEWRAYHEAHFSAFSQLIRSTFDDAVHQFSDGSIDLLHIDGCHTYDAVSHDFEVWQPKLSGRGIVLFHDINVREGDFGAWRLWERIREQWPSFEFPHGHGLGVLGVGQDLPEPVRWLLSLSAADQEAAIVRLLFARVGSAVRQTYAAAEARRDVDALRVNAIETEGALLTRSAEAKRLASEVEALDERAAELSTEIEARDELLAERARCVSAARTRVRDLKELVSRLEALVSHRDQEVLKQSAQLQEFQQAFLSRDARITELERELEEKTRALRIHQMTPFGLGERDERPTVLLVSHVGPWKPKAGNEYRLQRMLQWYRQRGYRTVLVVAPLPSEELPRRAIDDVAAEFGNVVQVHRDGTLDHCLRDVPARLPDRAPALTYADLLGEQDASGRQRELLNVDRTFCHDAVISTVLELQRAIGPHILQVEYIWMTRMLPLIGAGVLKVVDTVDVFSSIGQKVKVHGLRDLDVNGFDEGARLRRADLAIAIQDDERRELEQLAPDLRIITAGVDFDVVDRGSAPDDGHLLYVASGNRRNRKGLSDFLRFAWPRIRRAVPSAELVIVGGVVGALNGSPVAGVTAIGPVDDVTPWYDNATLVINPVIAGTGLKIKTVEALCHLRRVVTWPTGVEGLDPRLASMCVVASDWFEFAECVVDVLTRRASRLDESERRLISELFAPTTVYGALDAAYESFFEQKVPVV